MKTLKDVETFLFPVNSLDKKLIDEFKELCVKIKDDLQTGKTDDLINYIQRLSTSVDQGSTFISRLFDRSFFQYAYEANELANECMVKSNSFTGENKSKYNFDKAKISSKLGKYNEAEIAHAEGLSLLEKLPRDLESNPINRYNYAAALNNYGDYFREVGNFATAREKYNESIQIKKSMYDPMLPYLDRLDGGNKQFFTDLMMGLSISYLNIGLLERQLGNYKDALRNYEEAKKYTLVDIDSINSGLADVYFELGNHNKSDSLRAGLSKQNANIVNSAEDIANNETIPLALRAKELCNQGTLLIERGELEKGHSFYLKALSIYIVCFDVSCEKHTTIASVYCNLADYHLRQETEFNRKIALQYYQESFKIYLSSYSKQNISGIDIIYHSSAIEVYINIANLYKLDKDYDRALNEFKNSIFVLTEYWKKQGVNNHPRIAKIKRVLGEICLLKDEYQKSLQYYNEALDVNQKIGEHHPDIARIHKDKAELYIEQGDLDNALKSYGDAEQVWGDLINKQYINKFHFEASECKVVFGNCHYIYAVNASEQVKKGDHLNICISKYLMVLEKNKQILDDGKTLTSLSLFDFSKHLQLLSMLTSAYIANNDVDNAKKLFIEEANYLLTKIKGLKNENGFLYLIDFYLKKGYEIAAYYNDKNLCCEYLKNRVDIAIAQKRILRTLIFLRKIKSWDDNHPYVAKIVPLSQEKFDLDEDVESKLHHLKESYHELMQYYLHDLASQAGELSDFIKNRTGEIIIGIRSILDHVYTRFTRTVVCVSHKSPKEKAGSVKAMNYFYYPNGKSEAEIEESIAKKWNIDALPVAPKSIHPNLNQAYLTIAAEQTVTYFSPAQDPTGEKRKKSWLEKINNIHNDTKHLRLTPQAGDSRLDAQLGFLTQRKVKVTIDFVQQNLTPWCFIDFIYDKSTYQDKFDLSDKLYKWLITQNFITSHGEITNFHLYQYAEAFLKDDKISMITHKNAFEKEISNADSGFLANKGYLSYVPQIVELIIKRILQQRGIEIIPDQNIDLMELLETAIAKAEFIAINLHQVAKTKLSSSHQRVQPFSTDAILVKYNTPSITNDNMLKQKNDFTAAIDKIDESTQLVDLILIYQQLHMLSAQFIRNNNFNAAADIYIKFSTQLNKFNPSLAYYTFNKANEILSKFNNDFEYHVEFLLMFYEFCIMNKLFNKAHKLLQAAESLLIYLSLGKRNNFVDKIRKAYEDIKMHKSNEGYDNIDTDVISQLEYISEQMLVLGHEQFSYLERLYSGVKNELANQYMINRHYDLIIKIRHALENIFKRVIVLTVNEKDFSKGDVNIPHDYEFDSNISLLAAFNDPALQLAQKNQLIALLTKFQDFSHIANGKTPWLHIFVKASNFLKHTGALILSCPSKKDDLIGKQMKDVFSMFLIESRAIELNNKSFINISGLSGAQSISLFNYLNTTFLIKDGEFCKSGGKANINELKKNIKDDFFKYILDKKSSYSDFQASQSYKDLISNIKKWANTNHCPNHDDQIDKYIQPLLFNLLQVHYFRELRDIKPHFSNYGLLDQFKQAVTDTREFSKEAFILLKNTSYIKVTSSFNLHIDSKMQDSYAKQLESIYKVGMGHHPLTMWYRHPVFIGSAAVAAVAGVYVLKKKHLCNII